MMKASVISFVVFFYLCYAMASVAESTSTKSQSRNVSASEQEQDINKIDWWKKTNFYHIYLRSFRDSNGDGNGDLRGVIEKLDYLKQIGVETILMAPFYSSPMKDGGYDIDDYLAINPMFGTMDDFDQLVEELRQRDMKIVVDFVPNHTSDKHLWFNCSERAFIEPQRCAKYRDYYVWSNSTRYMGKYPTNWVSVFGGGSAWQWSRVRKEFYLHQFLAEQPDLNVTNPLVREELKQVARFWLRKGADGLRIDAAKHLVEDTVEYRDEPVNLDWKPGNPDDDRLSHIYTRSLPESAAMVADWQQVCQEPEFRDRKRIIITEVYDDQLAKVIEYYGPSPQVRYADMPFNFELMKLDESNLNASSVKARTIPWIRATRELGWPDEHGAKSPWICWVTGNHDNMRLANKIGAHNVVAFRWLTYLLPGVPVNYYGDEMSLHDSDYKHIPKKTIAEGESTRLPERAPIAWTPEQPSGGFSTSADIWMPLNADWKTNNVQYLLSNNASHPKNPLKLHLQLERIRRERLETLVFGDLVFYSVEANRSNAILAMGRVSDKFGGLLLLVNYDKRPTRLVRMMPEVSELDGVVRQPPKTGKVLLTNLEDGSLSPSLKDGAEVDLEGLVLVGSQAAIIQF